MQWIRPNICYSANTRSVRIRDDIHPRWSLALTQHRRELVRHIWPKWRSLRASSKSNDESASITPCSCVVLVSVLLRSGVVVADALVVVDASTCCVVAFGPWFPCLKSLAPLLITCCALANTPVTDLGAHWIRAFTCGDVRLGRCFFLLDFDLSDFGDFTILKDWQLRSWADYHSWSLK